MTGYVIVVLDYFVYFNHSLLLLASMEIKTLNTHNRSMWPTEWEAMRVSLFIAVYPPNDLEINGGALSLFPINESRPPERERERDGERQRFCPAIISANSWCTLGNNPMSPRLFVKSHGGRPMIV